MQTTRRLAAEQTILDFGEPTGERDFQHLPQTQIRSRLAELQAQSDRVTVERVGHAEPASG